MSYSSDGGQTCKVSETPRDFSVYSKAACINYSACTIHYVHCQAFDITAIASDATALP